MDLFYKIKALHEKGIKITLHCFEYGRGKKEALSPYCSKIFYYERFTGKKGFSLTLPYIVKSRANPLLLENLMKDPHPVLLEGVHCSFFLEDLLRSGKKVLLRAHNIESTYYRRLAACERKLWKKLFYRYESHLLRKYETKLPASLDIYCVSETDAEWFRQIYGPENIHHLPVFIPCQEITGKEGTGNFCLYHGNLGIAENERAAIWLLQDVFTKIKIPFVVAGKNPSRRLQKLAHLCQHTCLVSDPSDKELNELISKAHINILPSFNNTGAKLKVMMAICKGKHCLVNEQAIAGSGMEEACHIGTNSTAMASIVSQLYHHPYAEEEIRLREKLISNLFNNEKNAEWLIQQIW